MKAITAGTILVFVALLVSACGFEEQAKDPASVVQDFFDKINAGDLDGAMAYVPEDATYSTWEILSGREQIAEFYQREVERNILYELSDIEADGSEVTFRLKGKSDILTFKEQVWKAAVADGMLISLRFREN